MWPLNILVCVYFLPKEEESDGKNNEFIVSTPIFCLIPTEDTITVTAQLLYYSNYSNVLS